MGKNKIENFNIKSSLTKIKIKNGSTSKGSISWSDEVVRFSGDKKECAKILGSLFDTYVQNGVKILIVFGGFRRSLGTVDYTDGKYCLNAECDDKARELFDAMNSRSNDDEKAGTSDSTDDIKKDVPISTEPTKRRKNKDK